MIRVTVELVPFGNEDNKETIGSLVLANVKQIGMGMCLYDAAYQTVNRDVIVKQAIMHARQEGYWELIRKIIQAEEVENDDILLTTDSLIERL